METKKVYKPSKYRLNNLALQEHNMKQCRKCGRVLSITAFANQSVSRDGKNDYCRECLSLYNKSTKKHTSLTELQNRSVVHEKNKELFSQGLRICCKCGETLPLTEYNKKQGRYIHACKKCTSQIESERVRQNRLKAIMGLCKKIIL